MSDPVSFMPRDKVVVDSGLPESLRKKLSKPARNASGRLNSSNAAFWVVAHFSDDEMACVAVKAKAIGAAGHA